VLVRGFPALVMGAVLALELWVDLLVCVDA
jgi:hypothetical protein